MTVGLVHGSYLWGRCTMGEVGLSPSALSQRMRPRSLGCCSPLGWWERAWQLKDFLPADVVSRHFDGSLVRSNDLNNLGVVRDSGNFGAGK